MLRRYATILSTLAALVAGGGLNAQNPPPTLPPPKPVQKEPEIELEPWESPDKTFTLSYPKGWTIPATPTAGVAFAATNPDPASTPADTMQFLVLPGGGNAQGKIVFDTWSRGLKKALAGKVKDFKLVTEGSGMIAGVQGMRICYDGKPAETQCRTLQWTFFKSPNTYALCFVYDPKRHAQIQPIVQAVTKSLVVAKIATPDVQTGQTGQTAKDPTKPQASKGPILVQNKEYGFKFFAQPGWVEIPMKVPQVAVHLSHHPPNKPELMMTVFVIKLRPQEEVLLREIEENFFDMASGGVDQAKASKGSDIKLGGEPARRFMISGTRLSDSAEIRTLVACVRHGRDTLALAATAVVDELKAVEGDFDKAVASFSFTDPKPAAAAADAAAPAATKTEKEK